MPVINVQLFEGRDKVYTKLSGHHPHQSDGFIEFPAG